MRHREVSRALILFAGLLWLLCGAARTPSVPAQSPAPSLSAQQPKEKPAQTKPPAQKEQEEQETVRLESSIVTVYFNVIDHQNHYVTDLKKDDVRVFEDGKSEEIFSFGREVNLPLTFALLIDTSYSQQYSIGAERAAAVRFFEKVLRPEQDLASVISFEGNAEVLQKLTGNAKRLDRALADLAASYLPGVAAAGTPGINPDSRAGSTAIYDAIYAVATDELSREAGRRVIILLTDGVDTSSRIKQREAIEKAWHEEIQIYAVGIAGRYRLPDTNQIVSESVDRGTLNKICKETGGRAFYPRDDNELDQAFRQIEEDLRQQYIVTYSPSNNKRDGSFRAIKIETVGRSKVTVRHRSGYFAPRDKG